MNELWLTILTDPFFVAVAWTKTEKPPGPIRAFAMYPRALLPGFRSIQSNASLMFHFRLGFASLLGPEDKFREELLQVLREQPDLHTVGFFIPKTKDGVVKKLDDLNKVGMDFFIVELRNTDREKVLCQWLHWPNY